MKRAFSVIFALLFLSFNTITAYAQRPRAEILEIVSDNLTPESEYIELLIKLPKDDGNYTDFNQDNMQQYDFDAKELSEYCDKDGFISFSCHIKNNYTTMDIERADGEEQAVSKNFFTRKKDKDGNFERNTELLYDLYYSSPSAQFKVAVLDKNGCIIQTSKPFMIEHDNGYLSGNINYDMRSNVVQTDWFVNGFSKRDRSVVNGVMITVLVLVCFALPVFIGLKIFRKIKQSANNKS